MSYSHLSKAERKVVYFMREIRSYPKTVIASLHPLRGKLG